MKPFKSFLASEIEDYLQYRKSLGYKRMPAHSYLSTFDNYLAKKEADWHSFTPSFFLEMRAGLTMETRGINAIFPRFEAYSIFLSVAVMWAIIPYEIFRGLKKTSSCPSFSPPIK